MSDPSTLNHPTAAQEWRLAGPGAVPTALQELGEVIEQVELARATYRLRVACPHLAGQIRPGQFLMVRLPHRTDPLLGRPFALYDVVLDAAGRATGLDFVYHVIGKGTSLLRETAPGDRLELWGPLGNGFPVPAAEHLICVGGGIGYTPFLAVAREAAGVRRYGNPPRRVLEPVRRLTFCYGVRSRSHRADLADFEGIPNLDIRIATDDGSEGHHGLVTDLLTNVLHEVRTSVAVYCCGPEPMMRSVARLCGERGVACWLSLETPMACGFGACFSCVTKVKTQDPPGWDYRRTCVEGPVFAAAELALE